MKPEATTLDHFQVRDPKLVAETDLATVWQVQCQNGQPAALKIYHGSDMANEAAGYELLKVWDGCGAARLLGKTSNTALVEWLDGPSLGDLTRSNEDERANVLLLDVANKLHSDPIGSSIELPLVADWFEDLISLEIGPACPPAARRDMMIATDLALRTPGITAGSLAAPRRSASR